MTATPRVRHYDSFGYSMDKLATKAGKVKELTAEEQHLAECHLARYAKFNPLSARECAALLEALGLPVPDFVVALVASQGAQAVVEA